MFKVKKLETLNSSSVNLILDDDSSYTLDLDTVAEFKLYADKDISQDELDAILRFNYTKTFQEKAISYILYSPRSEYQVSRYLKNLCRKHKVNDDVVEEIIARLKEFKYINDEEFAELFLNSRLKNKPKSKYLLESELRGKGIDKSIARTVSDRVLPDDSEILKQLYERKFGSEKITFDDKKKIGFLQRRGFSWENIYELIKSFENNDI